jgi:hypothetical protein
MTEATHVYLPVSVSATQDALGPFLPPGATVYSVCLTAYGKLAEVAVAFPSGEYMTASVDVRLASPHALAAAWLTRWRSFVDDTVSLHMCGEPCDPEDIATYAGGRRHDA